MARVALSGENRTHRTSEIRPQSHHPTRPQNESPKGKDSAQPATHRWKDSGHPKNLPSKPPIGNAHHPPNPSQQRERAEASIGSDHHKPLAHSAKATPSPELTCERRTVPAAPHPDTCQKNFTFPASPEFPNIDHIKPMTFPLLSRIHRGAHRGSIRACKIVVLFNLLTAGCDPSSSTKTQAPKSPMPEAAATPSTALILAAVDNGFHRVPIALTTDYGFLVVNTGDDEHPIPSVSVGFRSERRVISCGSLAEFEAALRKVPPGSTIHRHERCLMPASRGLAEEFLAGIEPTLSRVGISVAPEPVITCLCGR